MNFVTVAALLDDKYSHPLTPYVIGMTVFQGVLAGWHVGVGCMNPARVFAPAVVASGEFLFGFKLVFPICIKNGMHAGFGEIVGACLAVIIERMVFAPIYTSCESDSNSPIWWWRIYLLYKDPNRKFNKRRKNFTSWATAFNKHEDTNREVHYAETTAELAAP